MINTTSDKVIFLKTGANLASDVEKALRYVSESIVIQYGLEGVDDSSITTRTNVTGFFSKVVKECTLKDGWSSAFDEDFVQSILDAYMGIGLCNQSEFYSKFTRGLHGSGGTGFSKTGFRLLNKGLGLTLVMLYQSKSITLPIEFQFPFAIRGGIEVADILDDGLLKILRLSKSDSSASLHYAILPTVRVSLYDTISRGSKMLMALGWVQPEDINLEQFYELLRIRVGQNHEKLGYYSGYMRNMIEFYREHYGGRASLNAASYDSWMRESNVNSLSSKRRTAGVKGRISFRNIAPKDAKTSVIKLLSVVPGTNFEIEANFGSWISHQEYFCELEKRQRINPKSAINSLSYLNLYLVYYLTYWFEDNPDTTLKFPKTPSDLNGALFVSRAIKNTWRGPLRFVEFMDEQIKNKNTKLTDLSYYSIIKKIEQFFSYLCSASAQQDDCKGFIQALTEYDFPKTYRSAATQKKSMSRQVYSLYINYVDTLISYYEYLESFILSSTNDSELDYLRRQFIVRDLSQPAVIDAYAVGAAIGYIPFIRFHDKVDGSYKTIPLKYIPNVFDFSEALPINGVYRLFARPHGLIHIATALYTGIRGQHIQWLDVDRFDLMHSDEYEYTKLMVGTDKVKRHEWESVVNSRVIEILRIQKRWRSMTKYSAFDAPVSYEGNNSNKTYRPFRPLFSYDSSGHPHPDHKYTRTWHDVLSSLSALLAELGLETGELKNISRLVPKEMTSEESSAASISYSERFGIGSEEYRSYDGANPIVGACTQLIARSELTPHSARVSVVTNHALNALPADLIGKHITGQKRGTVNYYYKPSAEDYQNLVNEQNLVFDKMIVSSAVVNLGKDLQSVLKGSVPDAFIRADSYNNGFVQAMKNGNLDDALSAYGCISISSSPELNDGVMKLKTAAFDQLAFNKTEVCPFNNICPEEVSKKLGGFNRCGLCHFAVRHIDHLPAICAKQRYMIEKIEIIEHQILKTEKYTAREIDELSRSRAMLAEELFGYQISAQVLESQRKMLLNGKKASKWSVQSPEILKMKLDGCAVPGSIQFKFVQRICDAVAYPGFDSPELAGKFRMVVMQLLANHGNLREAVKSVSELSGTDECIVKIKQIADTYDLDYESIPQLLMEAAHDLYNFQPSIGYSNVLAIQGAEGAVNGR